MPDNALSAFKITHWRSQREIRVSRDGRHLIDLPPDFPLAIRPLVFSHGYRNTPNFHDYLEISWIAQGKGTFRIGEKCYPVEPGDVFLNGNMEFHVLESDYADLLRVVNLYFLPELIYRPGGSMVDFEYLKPFLDHSIEFSHRIPHDSPVSVRLARLMARVNLALVSKPDHYRLEAKNALCDILLLLVGFYGQFTVRRQDYLRRRQKLERLQRVFQFLQEHHQERISLERLAEVACMSPSYLCRFFKQTTSYTLKEYLQRIRIDKAKELLIAGRFSITQVGLEVGFESHSYFDRIFRRLNGVSPREYCERFGSPSTA